MRTTTRPLVLLASSAALAVAATACGGDDGPPAEAADLVHVYADESSHFADEVVESVEWPDGQGTLRSPHARLTLADLSVAATYAPDFDTDEAYAAADGHELLVATFDTRDLGNEPSGDAAAQMSYAVVLGDRTEEIDPVGPGDTLVVSVPEGDDARLQVTDEDRAQSLSLRTGLRGDDAVAGMNEPQPSQEVDHGYSASGVATLDEYGPAAVDVSVDVGDVWRAAWHPAVGWAAPGRAWLVAETTSARLSSSDNDPMVNVFVNGLGLDSATFSVSTPDGATVAAASGRPIVTTNVTPPVYVFDVPEDTTTATLTITPGNGSDRWVEAPPAEDIPLTLAVG